jgi:hypothetical protein
MKAVLATALISAILFSALMPLCPAQSEKEGLLNLYNEVESLADSIQQTMDSSGLLLTDERARLESIRLDINIARRMIDDELYSAARDMLLDSTISLSLLKQDLDAAGVNADVSQKNTLLMALTIALMAIIIALFVILAIMRKSSYKKKAGKL